MPDYISEAVEKSARKWAPTTSSWACRRASTLLAAALIHRAIGDR